MNPDTFELDEVFGVLNGRKSHESGVTTYIMTMVSREPRQIVAFEMDNSVTAERIQSMVDRSAHEKNYYTDGGRSYDLHQRIQTIRCCQAGIQETSSELRA